MATKANKTTATNGTNKRKKGKTITEYTKITHYNKHGEEIDLKTYVVPDDHTIWDLDINWPTEIVYHK